MSHVPETTPGRFLAIRVAILLSAVIGVSGISSRYGHTAGSDMVMPEWFARLQASPSAVVALFLVLAVGIAGISVGIRFSKPGSVRRKALAAVLGFVVVLTGGAVGAFVAFGT